MVSLRTFVHGAKFLAGALAVHFVMAACSGSSSSSNKDSKNAKSGSDDDDDDDDPTKSASADDSKSGSRLKVRRVSTKDGATGVVGFYDSKLKLNCYFGKGEDGKTYCTPTTSDLAYYGESYFADPGCTQHVASATAGCTPKYVYEAVGTCEGAVRFHAVGRKVDQFYVKNGATCNPTPQTPGPSQDFFAVEEAVSPGTFVAGDEETE